MKIGDSATVPRQAARAASAQARPATESDRRTAIGRLQRALVAGRNADGGWGYYAGKSSRLEPTCWALLALGSAGDARAIRQSASPWLLQCRRPAGWLVENPEWPVNIAFNALAAFTLLHHRDVATDEARSRLLAFVVASKGAPAPPSDSIRQDNRLQGWSWMDATFSWVEPTCWGLLALKKARSAGFVDSATHARIAEAERLLIDRTCQPGGWNFGNAMVMGQDLRPYVPTTALGLLAMQDQRAHEAVVRSLATLEIIWREEISAPALALSVICLETYSRPLGQSLALLTNHASEALTFGNLQGVAQALLALSSPDHAHAFRL